MARRRPARPRTAAARTRHPEPLKGWTVIVLWITFVLSTTATIVATLDALPKVRHVRIPLAWVALVLSLLLVAAGATVSWLRARRSEP